MPVRFHCPQCRQSLSIARRKIGTVISCPRCAAPTTVPKESEGDAPADEPHEDEIEELVVFEDVPRVLQHAQAQQWPAAAIPTGSPQYFPAGPNTPQAWNAVTPRPAGAGRSMIHPELVMSYVFVHRWAIYAQGFVLLIVAGATFWLGWFAGNQNWLREHPPSGETPKTSLSTVVMSGSVAYETNTGRQPDSGAVVIVLPHRGERKKLKLPGWKGPTDGAKLPDEAVSEIRDAGGDVVQASDKGSFEIVVPEPGDYQLLVISAHGRRAVGQLVSKQHLDDMVAWFESPSSLIGWQLYHWQKHHVADPPAPLDILFPQMP